VCGLITRAAREFREAEGSDRRQTHGDAFGWSEGEQSKTDKEGIMAESTRAIAARCLEDVDFAQQVLESEQYPEVRDAIIADLEAEQEVAGHLNPQPLPPRESVLSRISWAQYTPVWSRWSSLDRVHLYGLAYIR